MITGDSKQKGGDKVADDNGGGNARAFGGIVAVLAVVAGIYATIQPMNMRIDTLERRIVEVTEHQEDAGKIIQKHGEFLALYAQEHKSTNNRLTSGEEWRTWWRRKYPILNAQQDEKIAKLEWYAYGKGAAEMFKSHTDLNNDYEPETD